MVNEIIDHCVFYKCALCPLISPFLFYARRLLAQVQKIILNLKWVSRTVLWAVNTTDLAAGAGVVWRTGPDTPVSQEGDMSLRPGGTGLAYTPLWITARWIFRNWLSIWHPFQIFSISELICCSYFFPFVCIISGTCGSDVTPSLTELVRALQPSLDVTVYWAIPLGVMLRWYLSDSRVRC